MHETCGRRRFGFHLRRGLVTDGRAALSARPCPTTPAAATAARHEVRKGSAAICSHRRFPQCSRKSRRGGRGRDPLRPPGYIRRAGACDHCGSRPRRRAARHLPLRDRLTPTAVRLHCKDSVNRDRSPGRRAWPRAFAPSAPALLGAGCPSRLRSTGRATTTAAVRFLRCTPIIRRSSMASTH